MKKALSFLALAIICIFPTTRIKAAPIPLGGIITVIFHIPPHERLHSAARNCDYGFSLCNKDNHPTVDGLTVQNPTTNPDGSMTLVGYIYYDQNNTPFVEMHFPGALASNPDYINQISTFDIETLYNIYTDGNGLNYDMQPGPAQVTTDVDGNLQATIPLSVH
ncbi:MAG: hypothetical protein ACTHJ0_07765 [Flavipsychrobacter sp.]